MRRFPELLLSMAVAHAILGNPFFGAAVFLFADVIKAYLFCNISRLRHANGENYTSRLLVALVSVAGLGVAFLYPYLTDQPVAGVVSLFVFTLVIRDALCAMALREAPENRLRRGLYIAGVQLLFGALCIWLLAPHSDRPSLAALGAGVVATGLIKIRWPDRIIPADGLLENRFDLVSSYRIFTNMNLYATIAMDLGAMLFFCLTLALAGKEFSLRGYGYMVLWLGMVIAILRTGDALGLRWKLPAGLSGFFLGAALWVVGIIFLYRTHTPQGLLFWMVVWGGAVALITTALRQLSSDFEAVAQIAGGGLDSADLEKSNTIIATVATAVSTALMLIVVAILTFAMPRSESGRLSDWLTFSILQLPVAFMLAAVYFALRHPLDRRNREKLLLFVESRARKPRVRENLHRLLVRKYRVRWGVRIICFFCKPFLRLKVAGLEHLRKEAYPSVFVCNHGFMYGPVAAVLYLPTYFRPWIHDAMLTREGAAEEIRWSFNGFVRATGKGPGMWVIRQAAKVSCWILNSFNPIPVARGAEAGRGILETFEKSISALEEGDNILIFPERPSTRTRGGALAEGAAQTTEADTDELRAFYTGFAHLGKMYHDLTGEDLLFYPLYSDRKERAFRIGEPVRYDSTLPARESKQAVAEELRRRIEALATGQR